VSKRRPKYGVVDSLFVDDAINVAAGALEREDPFRHQTNKQGTSLIYDGSNHLRIRLRYKKYQYPLVVGNSCPSGLLIRILLCKILPLGFDGIPSDDDDDDCDGNEDDEDAGVATKVGMEFTKENTLYRIRSFGSVVGIALCWF